MSQGLKQKIIKTAGPDLEKVESALEANLMPNLDRVKNIASHLLFSGGKRLRPLLMIHSARLCGYDQGFEIEFSTIFEYLHAATLLHDDVVDGSEIRRGKPAAHTKWSAPEVVLTGDFLLARALNIAAKTESAQIIKVIANITQEMSQGEINQLTWKGKTDLTQEQYLDVIEKKTAVLIQGACKSGALLAGADDETCQALDRYGFHLGMAFQMADDLLDYTATAKELGKNPGADMREGKMTLPLIYSLSRANGKDREMILAAMNNQEFNPDQFEWLKEKLYFYNGIEFTAKAAEDHVRKAKQKIERFAETLSKSLLMDIADYSISRKV